MTLQEAKDQFAATTIYLTWSNIYNELDGTSEYTDYLHKVAELYARAKWDEAHAETCKSLSKTMKQSLVFESYAGFAATVPKPEFKP